ncbi:MAG TPA: cyclic pyranopterin monophosphate synthase MoaC [Solirubrobacterales bacterium]|nr:cyclic pyranopterin monophosphate synthase MoaC [Solirubrobacterales bacterium]
MNQDPHLTHIDETGAARMVDVGSKDPTARRAVADARLRMSPETAAAIESRDAPKGDVIGTARIAGIQAAKRAGELIPLAHPLPLTHVDIEVRVHATDGVVEVVAEAKTVARTGVEMEAMTACAVAALTVYDMTKGLERGIAIERIELREKSGGRSGEWRRSDPQ